VSLVNRRTKRLVSSVISWCWGRVSFPRARAALLGGDLAISNGENAKFTRAAASWLEYSTEGKENRKNTARIGGTLASIPSNERQPHSVNSMAEIFYFPVPSYARFKGTKGDCKERTEKRREKSSGTVTVSLFDSHWTSCGDNFNTLRAATFRVIVTNCYRKRRIISNNGKVKRTTAQSAKSEWNECAKSFFQLSTDHDIFVNSTIAFFKLLEYDTCT